MIPNIKNRDITETNTDLAAELHALFIIQLENLIEKEQKLQKRNIGWILLQKFYNYYMHSNLIIACRKYWFGEVITSKF